MNETKEIESYKPKDERIELCRKMGLRGQERLILDSKIQFHEISLSEIREKLKPRYCPEHSTWFGTFDCPSDPSLLEKLFGAKWCYERIENHLAIDPIQTCPIELPMSALIVADENMEIFNNLYVAYRSRVAQQEDPLLLGKIGERYFLLWEWE